MSNVLICHAIKPLRQPEKGQIRRDFEKFPLNSLFSGNCGRRELRSKLIKFNEIKG
jgi:hypothetical protein